MKKLIVRSSNVISFWETDYGDYKARLVIGENDKRIGEVVVSYEAQKIYDTIGKTNYSKITKKEIEMAINILVLNEDFENLKMLPKISGCSSALQELYDRVCESISSMCFIEDECAEDFCNEDELDVLKREIMEFGLYDSIVFNQDEAFITAYGDLELSFIDDRGL